MQSAPPKLSMHVPVTSPNVQTASAIPIATAAAPSSKCNAVSSTKQQHQSVGLQGVATSAVATPCGDHQGSSGASTAPAPGPPMLPPGWLQSLLSPIGAGRSIQEDAVPQPISRDLKRVRSQGILAARASHQQGILSQQQVRIGSGSQPHTARGYSYFSQNVASNVPGSPPTRNGSGSDGAGTGISCHSITATISGAGPPCCSSSNSGGPMSSAVPTSSRIASTPSATPLRLRNPLATLPVAQTRQFSFGTSVSERPGRLSAPLQVAHSSCLAQPGKSTAPKPLPLPQAAAQANASLFRGMGKDGTLSSATSRLLPAQSCWPTPRSVSVTPTPALVSTPRIVARTGLHEVNV